MCFSVDVCLGWEVSHRPERYCVGLKHREDVVNLLCGLFFLLCELLLLVFCRSLWYVFANAVVLLGEHSLHAKPLMKLFQIGRVACLDSTLTTVFVLFGVLRCFPSSFVWRLVR